MAEILVVDDTRDVCHAMTKLLRALGHTANAAFSGEEAMAALANCERLPDLVVLDQMMPGMDGMEVLRQIRAAPRTASMRVVIFSAIADAPFASHAVSKGADAFWSKAGLDYTTLGQRIADTIAATPAGHLAAPPGPLAPVLGDEG